MRVSKWVLTFIFFATCGFNSVSSTENISWPEGMSFVALTEDGWQLHIVKPGTAAPEPVALNSEPRAPAYSPSLGLIAYISSEGDVLQYELATAKEKILLKKEANLAYTQPVYSSKRNSLIVVELQQARSKRTRIIEINLQTGATHVLSHQRSAQFEPVVDGQNLYYTNAHCIENCAGRYVHEIWVKNLISDDARQLTLLNTLTHQPALSSDGKFLYVSSEKNGGKRIWKCKLNSLPPINCEGITKGAVADTSPSVAKNGELYFIRLHKDGSKTIVKAGGKGELETQKLPKNITEIRDLEMGK